MAISLPPAMSKEIQELARKEHRTVSELVREAFRQYKMNQILEKGKKEGKNLRKGRSLTVDDIEKLIDALRK